MSDKQEDKALSLDQIVMERLQDGTGVVGSYILIAEVVHEEGLELRVRMSNGTTPWQATGMLTHALDYIGLSTDFEDEKEEEA